MSLQDSLYLIGDVTLAGARTSKYGLTLTMELPDVATGAHVNVPPQEGTNTLVRHDERLLFFTGPVNRERFMDVIKLLGEEELVANCGKHGFQFLGVGYLSKETIRHRTAGPVRKSTKLQVEVDPNQDRWLSVVLNKGIKLRTCVVVPAERDLFGTYDDVGTAEWDEVERLCSQCYTREPDKDKKAQEADPRQQDLPMAEIIHLANQLKAMGGSVVVQDADTGQTLYVAPEPEPEAPPAEADAAEQEDDDPGPPEEDEGRTLTVAELEALAWSDADVSALTGRDGEAEQDHAKIMAGLLSVDEVRALEPADLPDPYAATTADVQDELERLLIDYVERHGSMALETVFADPALARFVPEMPKGAKKREVYSRLVLDLGSEDLVVITNPGSVRLDLTPEALANWWGGVINLVRECTAARPRTKTGMVMELQEIVSGRSRAEMVFDRLQAKGFLQRQGTVFEFVEQDIDLLDMGVPTSRPMAGPAPTAEPTPEPEATTEPEAIEPDEAALAQAKRRGQLAADLYELVKRMEGNRLGWYLTKLPLQGRPTIDEALSVLRERSDVFGVTEVGTGAAREHLLSIR